jgi:hypothetical protein
VAVKKRSPVTFTVSEDGSDVVFHLDPDMLINELDMLSEHEVALLIRDLSQALAESLTERDAAKTELAKRDFFSKS